MSKPANLWSQLTHEIFILRVPVQSSCTKPDHIQRCEKISKTIILAYILFEISHEEPNCECDCRALPSRSCARAPFTSIQFAFTLH